MTRVLFPIFTGLPTRIGARFEVYAVQRVRNAIHHVFNPLHVYCRLKDIGLSAPMAQRVSRAYERYLFRIIIPS